MQLQEFGQTIIRHKSGKEDLILPARAITFHEDNNQIVLDVPGQDSAVLRSFGTNGTALDQSVDYLKIPRTYSSILQVEDRDLLVTNLNRRMARRGDDRRMVRTLEGTARAFLSDGFRRIDNEIVVDGLVPVAMKMGGLLKSVNVSDDYMNLTILFPKIEGEIRRGDVLQYGINIKNSEVGKGALGLSPFLYRLICLNGMTCVEYARRKTHVGGSYLETSEDRSWLALTSETQQLQMRAMLAEMAEYMEALGSPAKFASLLDTLRDKADQPLPAEPTVVVESLAARYGLLNEEKDSALFALAAGQDMTRWGLANAVTQIANTSASYDRSADLMALGGSLMTMPVGSYNALASMPRKSEVLEGVLV
jgi:succinate dehydrogenase flavin-adding protein (antitoxin of CptAB toxin-antitoxin module)